MNKATALERLVSDYHAYGISRPKSKAKVFYLLSEAADKLNLSERDVLNRINELQEQAFGVAYKLYDGENKTWVIPDTSLLLINGSHLGKKDKKTLRKRILDFKSGCNGFNGKLVVNDTIIPLSHEGFYEFVKVFFIDPLYEKSKEFPPQDDKLIYDFRIGIKGNDTRLIEQYKDLIYKIMIKPYRVTEYREHSLLDSEDWIQDGRIALVRGATNYDWTIPFFQYSATFIGREANSLIKTQNSERNLFLVDALRLNGNKYGDGEEENLEYIPDKYSSPLEQVEYGESLERLHKITRTIKPSHRRIARLLLKGYKQSDIARELGVTREAIRQKVVKIREEYIESSPLILFNNI